MFLENFVTSVSIKVKVLIVDISSLSDFPVDGIEADLSSMEVLKEPLFSRKLLLLIEILSTFRLVIYFLWVL